MFAVTRTLIHVNYPVVKVSGDFFFYCRLYIFSNHIDFKCTNTNKNIIYILKYNKSINAAVHHLPQLPLSSKTSAERSNRLSHEPNWASTLIGPIGIIVNV